MGPSFDPNSIAPITAVPVRRAPHLRTGTAEGKKEIRDERERLLGEGFDQIIVDRGLDGLEVVGLGGGDELGLGLVEAVLLK